jgi:Nucleotidyl transferase AbiEii toxin, Type IV TA system
MIHPDCFQRRWLTEQGAALRMQPHNLHLLERCIHALELVGRLSGAGLDFVFKGGTSLVLLLNPIRRLSIDVDIATPEPIERIKAVLDQVAKNRPPFLRYEHQERRDRDAPPTRHFKIHFPSAAGQQAESYILLDVMTTAHSYPVTERRSLAGTSFIRLEADSQVVLPTVDCILGDKLAAFAPRTIGVLFDPLDRNGNPRERDPLQIVKQLFDVGHLFAEAGNLGHAAQTYRATFEAQNRYRGGNHTLESCLADTIDAAKSLCLTPSDQRAAHTPHQEILRAGQRGLGTHLLTEPFTLDRHARTAAARAALLATLIKHGMTHNMPRDIVRSVPPSTDFQYIRLTGENTALDPILRRTAPEALYLWSLIEEAESQASDYTP